MTIKDWRGNDVQVQPGMTVWAKYLNDTARIYQEILDPDFGVPVLELQDCSGLILAGYFGHDEVIVTDN